MDVEGDIMGKKIVIIVIILCMFFVVFAPSEVLAANEKKYTVMIMLNGSDLESDGGAGTDDIQEMLEIGSDENINIIVQTGGTQKWQTMKPFLIISMRI